MTIARFILSISLIIFGGLKINPMKILIFKYGWIKETNLTNILVSVSFCIIMGFITSIFDTVTDIVSLSGSSIGFMLIFIFPTILALKTKYYKNRLTKIIL